MDEKKQNNPRNNALDGIRALSAVGIIFMHVLSNGGYEISGFIGEKLIPSFTDLVFLFMIVSGYAMCCGYYEKIFNKTIAIEDFYGRRIAKIWPFFAFLSLVDLALSPSSNSLYETFANLTLCFGFLPNADISVIGVGWFIGLVFVFYFTFPFFCYLLANKKRAWLAFAAALIFNYLCQVRFDAPRSNIVFSAVFFLAGGLLYLYREPLKKLAQKCKWLVFLAVIVGGAAYYWLDGAVPVMLVLFSLMVIYTMDTEGKYRILSNPVTRFLGNISLEMYLCHMVVFRVMEKVGLTNVFPSAVLSFAATAVGTLVGAIILSTAFQFAIKGIEKWIKRLIEKKEKTEI